MWLKLPEGSTFNTAVARSVKVGPADESEDANWALIAEMPVGNDVVLAQYHLPQQAQDAFDSILKGFRQGTTFLDLE